MAIPVEERDRMWKDPANWRYGVIYKNPDDPRIVVPKRWAKIGGWTLNAAHPGKALVFLALMIALLIPPTLALAAGSPGSLVMFFGAIVAVVVISWAMARG